MIRPVIRHVIFDLDGTLVDSCATCVAILTGMRTERGHMDPIDPIGARAYMSRGGTDMVAALLGAACADPAADLRDFRARYGDHRTPVETLFAGVPGGLSRLRAAGLTLSICSNKPQGLCEQVLADTGLEGFFAAVVGGQPGLRPKPAPDLLRTTLARTGAVPAECLFVGDSELDHQIAAEAGIPFLFLTHGYAEPGWTPPAGCDSFDGFAALADAVMARVAAPRQAAA